MLSVNETEKIIFEVFEKMGFLLGEPGDKAGLDTSLYSGFINCSINFTGDRTGSIELLTTGQLSLILAANVLGLDDLSSTDEGTATDAVKEFLNVYAGNFLADNYEGAVTTDLSVPDITTSSADEFMDVMKEDGAYLCMVEENPVLIRFTEE